MKIMKTRKTIKYNDEIIEAMSTFEVDDKDVDILKAYGCKVVKKQIKEEKDKNEDDDPPVTINSKFGDRL